MATEASVKLKDFVMMGIGHNYVGPDVCKLTSKISKTFLILPREECFVVVDETVLVVPRDIGRIEVDQVTTADIL